MHNQWKYSQTHVESVKAESKHDFWKQVTVLIQVSLFLKWTYWTVIAKLPLKTGSCLTQVSSLLKWKFGIRKYQCLKGNGCIIEVTPNNTKQSQGESLLALPVPGGKSSSLNVNSRALSFTPCVNQFGSCVLPCSTACTLFWSEVRIPGTWCGRQNTLLKHTVYPIYMFYKTRTEND